MKKSFLLVFLLFGLFETSAQEQYTTDIDRLKNELSGVKADSSKSLLMADLSEAYRWSSADSGLAYGHKALALSRRIGFPSGEVRALLGLSVNNREIGLLSKSVQLALEAHRIAEHLDKPLLLGTANVRIANAYHVLKDYKKASDFYNEAIEKVAGKDKWYEAAFNLLGALNYSLNDQQDSARLYFENALKYGLESIRHKPLLYMVQGTIEEKEGNYELAIESYHRGIKDSQILESNADLCDIFLHMADTFQN